MQLYKQKIVGNDVPDEEGGADLSKLGSILYENRRLFFAIVLLSTLLSAVISFFLPKTFRADATIMPISGKSNNSSGLAALAGQLSGFSSLASLGGMNSSTQQFMTLLKTRALAEAVINENGLLPILLNNLSDSQALNMERGVKKLRTEHVTFTEDKKSGSITVVADFRSPKLAADVANGYVAGLQRFIKGNALTVAKRNRIFIEDQLMQNSRDLLQAGKEINAFYKEGKISSVDALIDVSLVQFPNGAEQKIILDDVISADRLEAILKQKKDVEDKLDTIKTVNDVPQQVYLQYLALKKNLLIQINGLLTQQYEMAKIEESKEDLAFQLVDPAIPPVTKYGPKRGQIVMATFFTSIFLGFAVIFLLNQRKKKRLLTPLTT